MRSPVAYGIVSVPRKAGSAVGHHSRQWHCEDDEQIMPAFHRKSHFISAVFTLESVLNLAPYEKNRTHTLAVGSDSRNLNRLEFSRVKLRATLI